MIWHYNVNLFNWFVSLFEPSMYVIRRGTHRVLFNFSTMTHCTCLIGYTTKTILIYFKYILSLKTVNCWFFFKIWFLNWQKSNLALSIKSWLLVCPFLEWPKEWPIAFKCIINGDKFWKMRLLVAFSYRVSSER